MPDLARLAAVLCLGLATAFGAAAQIVVGMTSGFTGPVAPGVQENLRGARLWLDHVNATGGIGGRKVELATLDDRFEPAMAAENALRLIVERKVVALFLNRGTPHTEAIRPLLSTYEVPLVAPSSGAAALHSPVDRWIFNVRAPYQREAQKIVQHFATVGSTRIGVVHVDDAFGADALVGALRGFEQARLKPLFVEKFDRAKPDFAALVRKARQGDAQALVFIGSAGAVAEGTRLLRTAGSQAQVATLSNNASHGFVKELGAFAPGTIVAQVFPYERALGMPLIAQAHELARAAGVELTPAMLEGYTAAKVLVAGLRRAGPNPTRASLRTALEGLRVDLGGIELAYAPDDHSGIAFADLSIVDAEGRFIR